MSTPAPDSHRVIVMLVDDQPLIGQAVKRMMDGEPDIDFHYCKNPTEAVEMAVRVHPTVILQDLVMPEIDGLALVERYREREETRDVPVIVLSTREEPTTKADAFARGASDYIVKLPDRIELLARIRHHSKGYIHQLERDEAYKALAASQEAMAHDVAQAAAYVRSLLPHPVEHGPIRAAWRFIPSAELGGDTFGYHWIDDDHFAFYLIDVVGHGVGAALLSVSVLNAIRSQSLPAVDFRVPGQVLTSLNTAFEMSQHADKYFTAWYGVYQPSLKTIRYAGGGHPPALLVPLEGASPSAVVSLEATGPMVGAFDGLDFETAESALDAPSRLFLYSDGVFEIHKSDGSMWSFREFVELISQPVEPGVVVSDHLMEHTRRLSGQERFEDDFSVIELGLDPS